MLQPAVECGAALAVRDQLNSEADLGKGHHTDVESGSGLSGDEASNLGVRLVAAQLGKYICVEEPSPHSFTSRTGGVAFGGSKSRSRTRGSAIARTRAAPVRVENCLSAIAVRNQHAEHFEI